MPILDTPITTNDQNLDRILAQELPLLLVFHRGDIDRPLEDAINKAARKHSGDLLIARIDVREGNGTHIKYGEPGTPALVTLDGGKKHKVKSDAAGIRPGDVRAHIAHLLEDKPLPSKKNSSANAPTTPIVVDDKNFRAEVLKSKVPVLVDFWAAWCQPCHMIAPHVEKLAQEYGGRLKVAKMDVDRNQVMPRRYQVSSIPTLIIFEGGQPAERITGANAAALRKAVQRVVG
jgi:thioredoxin 1